MMTSVFFFLFNISLNVAIVFHSEAKLHITWDGKTQVLRRGKWGKWGSALSGGGREVNTNREGRRRNK